MNYPTDSDDLRQLADALASSGFAPTQSAHNFDVAKIDAMAEAMRDGSFRWGGAARQPVILGPAGEVLGGHHRVVAAQLAGIDLELVTGASPQVRRLLQNYRPVYDWIDVLPGVA